jgi:hypothetical protein
MLGKRPGERRWRMTLGAMLFLIALLAIPLALLTTRFRERRAEAERRKLAAEMLDRFVKEKLRGIAQFEEAVRVRAEESLHPQGEIDDLLRGSDRDAGPGDPLWVAPPPDVAIPRPHEG